MKSVRLSDGCEIDKMLTHLFTLVSPDPISASRMLFISCIANGGVDDVVVELLLIGFVVVLLHVVEVVNMMSVMMKK